MNERFGSSREFEYDRFLKQTKKLAMQYNKCHILLDQPRTNNGTERKQKL